MKHNLIVIIFALGVLIFAHGILAQSDKVVEVEVATETLTNGEMTVEEEENSEEEIEEYKKNFQNVLNASENTILRLLGKHTPMDLDTWEAPYELRKSYPYYLSGYDDESRPIWVAEIGSWNLRKVVEEGGQKLRDFDKYVQQAAYRALKSLDDRSTPENPVTEAVLLADMDKLNILQMAHVPTVSYVLHLAKEYQNLVAEHIHVGIAVNVNAVAQTLLNLVRPVFGRIFEKLEVWGTNRAKFIPKILAHVPKSQIAPWYGGTKDFSPIKVYGK